MHPARQRRALSGLLAALASLLAFGVFAATASADNSHVTVGPAGYNTAAGETLIVAGTPPVPTVGSGDHVVICHALGNGSYNQIAPSAGDVFGHAGASHQNGEDIIPPFKYVDNQGNEDDSLAGGQNWDTTGIATYNNGCTVPPPPATCPSGTAAVTSHTLVVVNGVATETFSIAAGCKGIDLGLASYQRANGQSFPNDLPQTLFDSASGTFDAGGPYTLHVNVPSCYWQVDFFTGKTPIDPLGTGSNSYSGQGRLIDTASGGSTSCTPPPATRRILVTKECKDVPGTKLNACPSGTFTFRATCPKGQNPQQGSYISDPLVVATCATTDGGEVCEINVPSNWKVDGASCVDFPAGSGDFTAHFVNQEVAQSPPPGVCPEGTTKISDNPLTCLKTVIIYGSPECPEGTTQVGSGQGFVVCATTVTVYGSPKCPSGSTQTSSGPGFVVCNTTTTNTVTNTVTVTVFGTPSCPSGSTQTSSGQGFVVCNTTTTVTAPAGSCPSGFKTVTGSNPVQCTKTITVIKKVTVKAKPCKKPRHVVRKPKQHKGHLAHTP